MSDSPLGTDAHSSRRDRRADRSRQRWRRVLTVTACTALLVGFGLVVTETVRLGGDNRPSLARTVQAESASPTSSSTVTTLAGRRCRTPLTDADPLRLWIGGDSLAGALGPSLGAIAGGTGVVQPQFDSRASSGLTSPTFFNWPEHTVKEMERLDPEVVVFIIGANDFNAPLATATDASGQPEWSVDYAERIEAMLSALDTDKRTVLWVGSPSFKDAERDASIRAIDDLAKEVVSKHKNAAYVDSYTLFTDADGEYQASLAPLDDPDGEPVPVRAGDGVHLTTQGADRLARAVFAVLDAQCTVTAQAAPGVVKPTIQTEGSTLVVGGTSRGGSVQTSPPASGPAATTPSATSPPATSPPETNPPATSPPATTSPAPPTTT